jgi:GTPase SAR1 family protein
MSVAKRTKVAENFFGQVIIGPPGSGKTTYCGKVYDFYKDKLNRKVEVVNLDPANENMNYNPAIDVMKLVTVEDVMDSLNLGPNGALMYCMEYLEENFDWLLSQLVQIKNSYLIFDMPGQVELYTHHNSIKNIFGKLEKIGYHLCAVHMVDSHYCSDPAKFISTLLLSLSTMMQIDVKSEKSLLNLKSAVDKANGYIYGSGEERSIQALLSCAVGSRTESERYDTDFF